MSYFDLSDKSSEELISLYQELNEKNYKLIEERSKLSKDICNIEKNFRDNHEEMRHVSREINRYKEIEESKNIIGDLERNIKGFELLNERELAVITTKMDRTDYRHYGEYPRWIDLERIIKEVIDIKKHYTEWKLTKLSKRSNSDKVPPETFYIYEFTDKYGILLDVGRIKA